MGSCRVRVAVERHTNHSQPLRPSRSLVSSFPPSLFLQDNLPQSLDHHTNVVHREATPQEECSEPSTDPRLKRNQHSHRSQDPYRVPPSTLFLNTTSLSRTPATTSALPRHAPPALLNRTIWSILVSAQPGWSQEQFSNSSHESWKGTGLRATSFRHEVVGVCDGVVRTVIRVPLRGFSLGLTTDSAKRNSSLESGRHTRSKLLRGNQHASSPRDQYSWSKYA
ncbi:hypothetical protein B0O80DRAFT_427822 [Mortierella sp. GBAus27b]|nr:hypothetical protein B0O80DRAFT_427822 [Mortierella sp. GBAus27b]